MALSTQNANLVWQKVKIALDSLGASASAREAFKALKTTLATTGGNKDLQFVALANVTGDVALADAACTLYGVYLKKQDTATAAFVKLNDHATLAGAANGANMTDCFELNAAKLERFAVEPAGRAMGTGLTAASETTGAGGTDTTSGDGPNGFVIISA